MSKLKIQRHVKVIGCEDWNVFIENVYGRPYNLQQQGGCLTRGTFEQITVPDNYYEEDHADSVPETENGGNGVNLVAWLARDPNQPVDGRSDYWVRLWWERSFYPHLGAVVNDLHSKGLLAAGEYLITVSW